MFSYHVNSFHVFDCLKEIQTNDFTEKRFKQMIIQNNLFKTLRKMIKSTIKLASDHFKTVKTGESKRGNMTTQFIIHYFELLIFFIFLYNSKLSSM